MYDIKPKTEIEGVVCRHMRKVVNDAEDIIIGDDYVII